MRAFMITMAMTMKTTSVKKTNSRRYNSKNNIHRKNSSNCSLICTRKDSNLKDTITISTIIDMTTVILRKNLICLKNP